MNQIDNDTILDLMGAIGTKVYLAAPLPADIERGPVGKCFDWCALQAARNRQYKYVEGIAREPDGTDWILHAWLTDSIHAFDPTWDAIDNRTGKHLAVPTKYIGFEMDILDVRNFMRATGYQGVLANRWRNPSLADACLDKVAA